MTKDNYSIYKHTSPSGKSYIGITKQGKKRFGKDGNGYKKQRKFYNAIQKYGWDNFKHEIIEDIYLLNKPVLVNSYILKFMIQ